MQDVPEMTLTERRKYLARMQPRYLLASRFDRSRLLDEMVVVSGLHRKSIIRLLTAPSLAPRPRTTPAAGPTVLQSRTPSA